jgi:hypothetical protein
MEEANPVGKVEINLEAYHSAPPLTDTELPDKADFSVDLVPRLSEFSQGDVKLSLMLERASASFTGPSARDNALVNLLGRLQSSRKRERMERVQRWWGNYPQLHRGSNSAGDYSLVALLTKDVVPSPPPPSSLASQVDEKGPGRGIENGSGGHQGSTEDEGGEKDGEEGRPIHGMLEKLSEAKLKSASRAPMRAQAELLARLKPIQFEDGGIIMAAGTQPESIFFVRSGAVVVTVNGEEVSRIEKGQCLGEVGLLLGERRIADVKSCGRTELFELMEQDLWMALDMFPGLYKELHRVAEMRYEHVQSGREEWGSTSANIYTQEGPLREFQQFLQDVSAKIPWHSHKLKKKAGMEINAVNNAAGPLSTPFSPPSFRGVDINSLSLGSISETGDFLVGQGEAKHEAASSAQTSNSNDASVSDQLSKRLEQFEQSGVFGIGGGKRWEDGEVGLETMCTSVMHALHYSLFPLSKEPSFLHSLLFFPHPARRLPPSQPKKFNLSVIKNGDPDSLAIGLRLAGSSNRGNHDPKGEGKLIFAPRRHADIARFKAAHAYFARWSVLDGLLVL